MRSDARLADRIAALNGFQVACILSGLLLQSATDKHIRASLTRQVGIAEHAGRRPMVRHITDTDSLEDGTA